MRYKKSTYLYSPWTTGPTRRSVRLLAIELSFPLCLSSTDDEST